MDRDVWSKLPPELLELSLAFLPLVDLCRFRAVCRRWNNLICSPEFGKRFVVNTARNANERACLLVNRQIEDEIWTDGCTEESRWSVLKLREKKWYDLKSDLWICGSISDMDGGFVCTTVRGSLPFKQRLNSTVNPKSLVVFNPFGGAEKVLPDPPSFDGELESVLDMEDMTVKLIVDNNCSTFKVLLIMNGRSVDGRFPISVYESSTDQWTTAPMPPFVQEDEDGILSRIVFQERMYCCSEFIYHSGGTLWSFNLLDGSWEDTGVHFTHVGRSSCELAVTDNRLFLARIFQEGIDFLLDISEILLASKITRLVVLTNISDVFPIGSNRTRRHEFRAFGLNNSKFLLYSSDGEVVMYNLAEGEWEWFPPNLIGDSFHVNELIVGRMDYCLPNAPW